MENCPLLEEIFASLRPSLPQKPNGRDLTPFEIEKYSFVEGLKIGLQIASEAFIC